MVTVSHYPFATILWQKTPYRFLLSCEEEYLCIGCFAGRLNLCLGTLAPCIKAIGDRLLVVGFKQMAQHLWVCAIIIIMFKTDQVCLFFQLIC